MEPDKNDHGMGSPTMHVTHEHAKRHVELQVLHIRVGVFRHRSVVEHQVDSRDDGNQKHEEGKPPHTPREPHPYAVPAHLGWM